MLFVVEQRILHSERAFCLVMCGSGICWRLECYEAVRTLAAGGREVHILLYLHMCT